MGLAASNTRWLVFSGTLFPSQPVWWIIQVLDLLRREKYKSSSLFIFQPQMQTLLGFAARLGSITFTKKIRFSWRLSWRLTVPIARRRKILPSYVWTAPLVAGHALLFLFWPHRAGHHHPSCRKFPPTCTLLFVLLHNKSNRWLHLFLTGPIFRPLIMFVA